MMRTIKDFDKLKGEKVTVAFFGVDSLQSSVIIADKFPHFNPVLSTYDGKVVLLLLEKRK